MKTFRLTSAALALVLCAAGGFAATSDQFDVFAAYLDALRLQAKIPGLSAVILRDGAVAWERGFGYADVERQLQATPDTPYQVASLTAPIGATVLLQCVEEGRLSLTELINRYTPAIPEAGATVGHVLTHMSQGTLGSGFLYDGQRFAELTRVIEACTNQPFATALARRILDRLGMSDSVPGQDLARADSESASQFDVAERDRYQRVLTRIAKPYVLQSDGRLRLSDYPPSAINAHTGLVSTVRDLARFDSALDQNVLLSPETRQLAWTPALNTRGQVQPYGLGWFVQTTEGVPVIWHHGALDQFSSLYMKLPRQRLTLLLLANSGELSARFNLNAGNIIDSPFARLFLRIFAS